MLGDLFQRKHADDIEGLSVLDATEDPIFSFYVDFADIDGDDLLSTWFNEYPEQTIELANEVPRSMFRTYRCPMFYDHWFFLMKRLFCLDLRMKPKQTVSLIAA